MEIGSIDGQRLSIIRIHAITRAEAHACANFVAEADKTKVVVAVTVVVGNQSINPVSVAHGRTINQ